MNKSIVNNENEFTQQENPALTKGQGGSSKKLYNQLYQSAQFDSMPSSFMNKSSIATTTSQTQISNKAFQERLNKSGIYFKNGTLVNITDIDVDSNQQNEKDEKIRDLEDKEGQLKKQLREVQAKLEKDIAILNQKLEFAELELKEAKQKIKDNDEFFRLFEINDLRYQQHPIFKQKFAQLNEMHNQQIAGKQREIENLRALLRQYNEPTLQSNESLNSLVFSQKKQQRTNLLASEQKVSGFENIEEQGQEGSQTPAKGKNRLESITDGDIIDENDENLDGEEKVKRNRNSKQSQQQQQDSIMNNQLMNQELLSNKEEISALKDRITQLESQIQRYQEQIQKNENNEQIILDLQQECSNLKTQYHETFCAMKNAADTQEKLQDEILKTKKAKLSHYKSKVKSQQQIISQKDQQIQEFAEKCSILENQQNELLEKAKSEQTAILQEQLNSIIAEREAAIQEYFEQEYLNKLEFYEKKHTEILEENQRNFEEQLQQKEENVMNQVQQRESCMIENMQMKQLQFDQKVTSYELQLQTKQQEIIAQQHAYAAAQEKITEHQKQIEQLTENIEKYSNENEHFKESYEVQNDRFEKISIRNEELQRECEQQHQLILQLELEMQQSTEKAKKLYIQQIQDVEAANQTYQLQVKELEQKVANLNIKLNNSNQAFALNTSTSSQNVSQPASEQKINKKKQKLKPGAISNLQKGEGNDQQLETGVDESVDEDRLNLNQQQNNSNNQGEAESNNNDQSNITMFSASNISYNLGKVNSVTQQQTKLIQQLQNQLQQQQTLFLSDQQKIRQETTQLQSHIKQLEQLLLENREAYYQERNVLENNIQKVKSENKELYAQIQQEQKSTEVIETKKQLNDLTLKYNASEEQKKVLQSRLDKIIEQQSKQIESESSSNQILLQVKNNEINEYRIRIEVLQNQLKEQDSLVKKTQSNAQILEIEKNELLQQVNFLENQQEQAQEQIVQQYENELQSLSSQLHEQIAEFAEERQRFLDTIESLQQSINFQNSKNQELIQQCEQIEQEEGVFEQQQEAIRNLEEKLQSQDVYIAERENCYSVEMQKKEKNITDLLNQVHILEMNRKQMMDEVEQEQERFLAQIQNQRQSQVSQSQSDQLTSKQIILALQQERDYLQKKIEILESQKESLKSDLSEITQKFESQQTQDEKVKNTSPNRNFGFVSFKAGSNCVSFAPQQLGGLMSSSPGTQNYHRKGNSVHQINTQGSSNNPVSTSQSQIFYGGSQHTIQANPSYDNGQYLNTSQFGGCSSSNYMSNSTIVHNNPSQQYQTNHSSQNGNVQSGNSMVQSSILSCGQSFIQNNNHIIFGSVNHSSLYGLSQAQMLEIIERAYMDRLQQQQLYFEQKIRKEREDNAKRSREPALIADKKKLQADIDKLNKEVQLLRTQKQREDEFSSMRGHQHQILQETANLCQEKSRSKNRPTRDISTNKEGNSEADKLRSKLVVGEKKCFDLNLNKTRNEDKSSLNLNEISQNKSKDLSNYFSPNKLFTDGDVKKNKTIVVSTITSIQQGLSSLGNNTNQSITNSSTKSTQEAGTIVGQRHQRGKNSITSSSTAGQISSSLNNQNISPIQSSLSSITSSQSSNFQKQSPMQQSLLLSQQSNKGPLQQSSNASANNNYTKAYGAKESTLISINSNNSDVFKSNIFNSNNTSSSFLKNSNIGESFLKNTPSHNTSIQNNIKSNQVNTSNSLLSAFPHRDSTPTTVLKKSYINFDEPSQNSLQAQQSQYNQQNSSSHISRMQRSITEQKLFNTSKLNITSQKY